MHPFADVHRILPDAPVLRRFAAAVLLFLASQAHAISLTGFSCSPTTFTPGDTTYCTGTISEAAPLSGVPLSVTTNGSGIHPPPTVRVAWGGRQVTFPVGTETSASVQTAQIRASDGSVTKTVTVSVVARLSHDITAISCVPVVLIPGAVSHCTVTLSAQTPSGGLTATLASHSSRLSVPASAAIRPGMTGFTFDATAAAGASADENTWVALTLGGRTSAAAFKIKATPAFYLAGNSSEASGLTNGSAVRPTIMPAGWSGRLTVKGTGALKLVPVTGADGMAFYKGGGQAANTAFAGFSGSSLASVFDSAGESEISFVMKSAYTFAQRRALPDNARQAVFSVWDGSTEQFGFATYATAGGVTFQPSTRGQGAPYIIPAAQADHLFGPGAVARIRIRWTQTSGSLYVNDALVRSWTFAPTVIRWGSGATFIFGSSSLLGGGYYSATDPIADFKVLAGANQAMLGPMITAIMPATAATGSSGFALAADGINLSGSTRLYWGSAARATTVRSATALQASIPSSDLASPGTVTISVSDNGSAGSFAIPFSIGGSAPTTVPPTTKPPTTVPPTTRPPTTVPPTTRPPTTAPPTTKPPTTAPPTTKPPTTAPPTTRPPNHAPVAQNQSVTTPEDTAKSVTLAATDADGNALTYSIVAPPAHGTLSGAGASRLYTPLPNYNGNDRFTFKANDGSVDSNIAAVTVTVTAVNDPPVAAFTATPPSGNAPLTVRFDAAGSHDIDGTIQAYQWNFGDGGAGAGSTISHVFTHSGSFSVRLTVTDNNGAPGTASHAVSVGVAPNPAPVAQNQSVTLAEDTSKTITLFATDANHDALTYAIVTSPAYGTLSGTGNSRLYTPVAHFNGADSFTFKANDGTSDSNVATVAITVTPVNSPPVASFTAGPASGTAPLTVAFNASASNDPDGTIRAYAWSFGDGGTGSGVSATHVFRSAGTFTIKLTVTDNNGALSTATQLITATLPKLTASLPGTMTLDGTLAIADYPAADVNFVWTFSPVTAGSASPALSAPAFGAPARASFKSGAQTQTLASYGLNPGTYDVSVYAQDTSSDPPRQSNTVGARMTLLAETVTDFSAVQVFPNPWRSDRHGAKAYVTFAHLPSGSTVKIFTVSGYFVKTLSASADSASWDLTNDAGDRVASGIYLYLLTDAAGNTTRGKLAIIR